MWNPSTCACECDKYCEVSQYLDYKNSRHLHHIHILYAEAVVRKCSSKEMFLKISQISQESMHLY